MMEHQNNKHKIVEKLEQQKDKAISDKLKEALQKKIENINKEYIKK